MFLWYVFWIPVPFEKESLVDAMQVVRGGCQKIVSILDLEPGDIVRSSLGGQVSPFATILLEVGQFLNFHA
jgi:hypothetical protein